MRFPGSWPGYLRPAISAVTGSSWADSRQHPKWKRAALRAAPSNLAPCRAPGLLASPGLCGLTRLPSLPLGPFPNQRLALLRTTAAAARGEGGSHPHPAHQNNRNGRKRKPSFNIYVITQSGKVSQITHCCAVSTLRHHQQEQPSQRVFLSSAGWHGMAKGSRPSPPSVVFFGEENLDSPNELTGSLTHLVWGCLPRALGGHHVVPVQENTSTPTTTHRRAVGSTCLGMLKGQLCSGCPS